jgi:hypothetical protein
MPQNGGFPFATDDSKGDIDTAFVFPVAEDQMFFCFEVGFHRILSLRFLFGAYVLKKVLWHKNVRN